MNRRDFLTRTAVGAGAAPVVLYSCFKRYLVSGLVSGAVSGT